MQRQIPKTPERDPNKEIRKWSVSFIWSLSFYLIRIPKTISNLDFNTPYEY